MPHELPTYNLRLQEIRKCQENLKFGWRYRKAPNLVSRNKTSTIGIKAPNLVSRNKTLAIVIKPYAKGDTNASPHPIPLTTPPQLSRPRSKPQSVKSYIKCLMKLTYPS